MSDDKKYSQLIFYECGKLHYNLKPVTCCTQSQTHHTFVDEMS